MASSHIPSKAPPRWRAARQLRTPMGLTSWSRRPSGPGAEKYAWLNGVQAVGKMVQLSLDPENRFIRYDYRANRSVREAMTNALRFFAFGLALCMCTAGQADTVGKRLDRLVRAYPQAMAGHDERFLYWRDGTRMSVGEPEGWKSFDDLLRRASILDQLSLLYPQGDSAPPAVNADPGRFRNEAFFKKMYGDCSRDEVSANLVALHSDFDRLGPAVRLAPAGVSDQRGPRCCEASLAAV
jgi:hypothetical protein